MKYLLLLLLLVAGCQEQLFRQPGNVYNENHIVWTDEHTRLLVALGIDHQVKSLPYENIRLEKE